MKRSMQLLADLLDDLLLLAGGGCILYGLAQWSAVVTWIAGGLMLIGLAVLVGKAKVRNAADEAAERKSETEG